VTVAVRDTGYTLLDGAGLVHLFISLIKRSGAAKWRPASPPTYLLCGVEYMSGFAHTAACLLRPQQRLPSPRPLTRLLSDSTYCNTELTFSLIQVQPTLPQQRSPPYFSFTFNCFFVPTGCCHSPLHALTRNYRPSLFDSATRRRVCPVSLSICCYKGRQTAAEPAGANGGGRGKDENRWHSARAYLACYKRASSTSFRAPSTAHALTR